MGDMKLNYLFCTKKKTFDGGDKINTITGNLYQL
jgi:hypothetical protein